MNQKKFPFPLSPEAFPDAWAWAGRQLRQGKRGRAAASAVRLLALPLFTLILTLLVYGLLYDFTTPVIQTYLGKLAPAARLWARLRDALDSLLPSRWLWIPLWAAALYLVPFVLSLPLAVVPLLLYFPRTPKLAEGDSPAQQAKKLCQTFSDIQELSAPQESRSVTLWNILFAVLWCGTAFGYIIYITTSPEATALNAVNSPLLNAALAVAAVALFLCYRLLCTPLTQLIHLLEKRPVPDQVVRDAQAWADSLAAQETDTGRDRLCQNPTTRS